MISKELRKIIIKRYNIEESLVNRPIHYKFPENIGLHPFFLRNNPRERNFRRLINKINANNKKYSKDKEKTITQMKNNIKRNKVDLLFNKTYDKINNNFRISDTNSIPKKKLETLSVFSKEKIKDEITKKCNFYNKLLHRSNQRNKDNYYLEKQYTWSNTLLEQKDINKIKNFYTIKYVDTVPFFPRKIYYNQKYKKDGSIPSIIKLNTPIKSLLFNKKLKIVKSQKYVSTKNKNKDTYDSENKENVVFKPIF
jgi:hypothetical protein